MKNLYIPPRASTPTNYKTADTHIQNCIQYITSIPHSVLRGQLIADVISNSAHKTLNTNTPHTNRSPKHHTTTNIINRYHHGFIHCTTGHREQLNTHYHQITYPSSPQLTYDMTTDYNKTNGLSPTTRKLTGHNSQKPLHFTLSLRPTDTLPT